MQEKAQRDLREETKEDKMLLRAKSPYLLSQLSLWFYILVIVKIYCFISWNQYHMFDCQERIHSEASSISLFGL